MRQRLLMIGAALAVAVVLGALMVSCEQIKPGYVGLIVHYSGSDRGEVEVVGTGRQFFNPLTASVLEFPTSVQTASWTHDAHEGSPQNEEISFNSKEGVTLTADISLSYQLEAKSAGKFYSQFRDAKLDNFTHGFMRNIARDAFNNIASTYSVEDLYGEKKAEFIGKVHNMVNSQTLPFGISITQFGFIGAMRLPEAILESMNAKITANQQALRSQNELAISQAEAAKEVATAEGHAKALIAAANGQADANSQLAKSITPELIRYKQLEVMQKWDGKMPTVMSGSGGTILQLPMPAAGEK